MRSNEIGGIRASGWRAVATVALVAASGCLGGDPDSGSGGAASQVVRDSVGIRIVENAGAAGDPWTVSDTPLFTVGWDPEGPLFSWPQSAAILPDGGAVVGETSEARLYRLGPDGALLDSWGTRGEGPGEYEQLNAILLRGDTLLISDTRQFRVTFLTLDGQVLDTRRVPVSPLHRASSVLPSGRLVFVPLEGYGRAPEVRPEWVFETMPTLAVGGDPARVDTLADLPHLKRWYGSPGGAQDRWGLSVAPRAHPAGSPGLDPIEPRCAGSTTPDDWRRSRAGRRLPYW